MRYVQHVKSQEAKGLAENLQNGSSLFPVGRRKVREERRRPWIHHKRSQRIALPSSAPHLQGLPRRALHVMPPDLVPTGVDPETGVSTKDVVISPQTGVAVHLFLLSHPNPPPPNRKKLLILIHFHGGGFCGGSTFNRVAHNHLTALSAQIRHENSGAQASLGGKLRHNYVTVATRVIPLPTAPSPASSAAAGATRVIPLPTAPSPASSSAGATLPTLDENYAFFRQRANAVRLLQLGLTFSDEGGNLPKDPMTGERYLWEFNVKVAKSMDEIDAVFRQHLTEKGIDVDYNMKHGIHPDMLCTGIWCMETLMKERIRWVVFSGCAAFSPLLNIMRPEQLPVRREAFLDAVKLYFSKFYELRQLMSGCGLSGTLEETANVLGVGVTEGEMFNQAGPDSLLTLQVFLGLRKRHFRRGIPEDQANLINYIRMNSLTEVVDQVGLIFRYSPPKMPFPEPQEHLQREQAVGPCLVEHLAPGDAHAQHIRRLHQRSRQAAA
ncbi:putative CCR4-associated factor 1-like protein 10 [Nymphaea thermarum]|nr:putative CCR4-associated factor 1-like protein 10 [Nymphaea thermarum]